MSKFLLTDDETSIPEFDEEDDTALDVMRENDICYCRDEDY